MKSKKEIDIPRNATERNILEHRHNHKLKMNSFIGLATGALIATPIVGAILGTGAIAAVGGAIFFSVKACASYYDAKKNSDIFNAMQKENSIKSTNYRELTKIAEVINDKESLVSDVFSKLKQLRQIQKSQNQNDNSVKLKI